MTGGERGWPQPKRNRFAEATIGKGKATVKGGNTFHAKANGSTFAGNGRRAMPFKATGHKGGISFR